MSENARTGVAGLYFIVGGLVVVAGLGAFWFSEGNFGFFDRKTASQQTTSPAPAKAGNMTTTTTTEKTKQ